MLRIAKTLLDFVMSPPPTTLRFDLASTYNQPVVSHAMSGNVEIGQYRFNRNNSLDFGDPIGVIGAKDLDEAAMSFAVRTCGTCRPQLASLLYRITKQPHIMNTYFPITRTLDESGLDQFYQLTQQISKHPNFDLRLLDANYLDVTDKLSPDTVYLVAGHLAETFFYRQDILEYLLRTPRHIWLYSTSEAFKQSGGVAGGNYSHKSQSVQLVLSRLYEGFYDRTPGVAPFLHEFGHMLDFFDASKGAMGDGIGLLPGLRPTDGAIYTPRAHDLFRKGKQIELDRYLRVYNGSYNAGDPIPTGHPYVLQNDTEFVAGYFEMFFRNPHYFSTNNPDLYQAFVELFCQDTRLAWDQDFPFYVQQNRDFYFRGSQKSYKPNLTIR